MPDRLTRRRWIALGASATLAAFAGCTSDDGGDGDSDGDSDGGTDGGSDGDAFGDSLSYPDSYSFTISLEQGGSTTTIEGRHHQGNLYFQGTFPDGGQYEYYNVEGEIYLITQGTCFKNPDESQNPAAMDPSTFLNEEELRAEAEENPTVEPVDTTTIDGVEVKVYELGEEAYGTVQYYVATDTGYPRRVEFDGGQIDLRNHGSADPISPPDMNCQEM